MSGNKHRKNTETDERRRNAKKQGERQLGQLEICISDESTDIAVTKNQITQLHQFIHKWGEDAAPYQTRATGTRSGQESTMEANEKRTIKESERDILNYLNQRGLQRKNI